MEKDAFTTLFKKRLAELVTTLFPDSKGSAVKLADSLKTSPGHVRDWLGDGRPSLPSAAYLKRIYDEHRVNLNWLVPGDSNQPMFRQEAEGKESVDQGAPLIHPEHIQKAYLLVKEGLGKHQLPEKTEGYIVGQLAEGVAEGRSIEYLLKKFSGLVEMVAQQRTPRRK